MTRRRKTLLSFRMGSCVVITLLTSAVAGYMATGPGKKGNGRWP